ncbi:aspartate-semialdehyde dehydrogenase [candidate division NPL-UPA2 bacterium Unc8]|uniref:Aspartate-semialdehyde dehydrogenase n=1 Tax=candidate division NPL-UPA2 bacterium Unc8 TaxID=1980939 RepID=A0A399FZG6_UNCN2|nr:Aspartate-semialdehyde dehydrogenase [Bacillota bacterium]RII00513.1 MAG: aspartate-semialdehyde dehydrogenase [candidate division NPL-UPA2 bacterium Unc8]
MRKFKIAVVGIGLVGREIIKILKERSFPASEIKVLATRARTEEIGGEKYAVSATTEESFQGIEITFFAGTEGAKGASKQFGWQAASKGTIVIDNGDDYRLDSRVPLIVPEVNAGQLRNHQGFISSPNCATIQLVIVLAPLHRRCRIKRVIVSSYQSVSGTGGEAVEELRSQVSAIARGEGPKKAVYPHQIAFNLFPEIGSLQNEFPGYYREEAKTIKETRKILNEPEFAMSATCVRVPVYFGHSEAVNVEFEKRLSPEEAREILSFSPGVRVIDKPEVGLYPTPIDVVGGDDVYVGRIRDDPSSHNSLNLWIVGDNIRKGAALNTVQIAEEIIKTAVSV